MNRKGFMMAEVIVVSAIVLIVLGTMFVSYNKLLGTYKSRVSYYDAVTIYRLGYYRDILIENEALGKFMEAAKNSPDHYVSIYDSGNHNNSVFTLSENEKAAQGSNDRVFLIYNNQANLTTSSLGSNPLDQSGLNIHKTFNDYLRYLTTSTNLKGTNYVLIMERCDNTKNTDNDCKYAYLEVYDGCEGKINCTFLSD